MELFQNTPDSSLRPIPVSDGLLFYAPAFIGKAESDICIPLLQQQIAWRQETIRIFGKSYLTPRLTAWVGDAGKSYSYSGLKLQPGQWTELLLALKLKVETTTGYGFNSVLLNWYRNGNDSMGWHSDDEKELGRNPVIASLSFGAPRTFRFRNKTNHKNSVGLTLENGSLLLMAGTLQHHWQHCLPRSSRQMNDRINLTFRTIVG